MSLIKNLIRPLAAVALVIILSISACQAPQEVEAPASKASSQPTPAKPLPGAFSKNQGPEFYDLVDDQTAGVFAMNLVESIKAFLKPQVPEFYRLEFVDAHTAGIFEMKLVESVMPDGSIATPAVMPDGSIATPEYETIFYFTHVAGITAPKMGECGDGVSLVGARKLINTLFDQDPNLGWTPLRREEILPTYRFEVPAADIEGYDPKVEHPTLNLSVNGVLLAQELVSAGLAFDSEGRWAQEQASAQAAGLGIWAECSAP